MFRIKHFSCCSQGYFQRLNSKTGGADIDAEVQTSEFMWTFDTNGDEKISLKEFKTACKKSTNRPDVTRQLDNALQLLRTFDKDLKKDHVLYASLAHPLAEASTTPRRGLHSCDVNTGGGFSKHLWNVYVADDESGKHSTKGIHVTANPVGSNGLERQELRTSIDQLKTLMRYLMQLKVPYATELHDKLQTLELLDAKRNFSTIRGVLDEDDCAHLGKCVVEQLCWNGIAKRLEYRDALRIATMTTSKAIRISCSPSLQRLFPNVQGVSCLHAALLQNHWWTTVKEEPSHTKDGTPACRGLVVCAVDMHNTATEQMLHLAVSALADFAKEVAVNIYANITSKIQPLDGNGNYTPMSALNIHQRHALAQLVIQHITYENECLGFTFHEMIVRSHASIRKRKISQESIDRLNDVEYLLNELEFQKKGISRQTSIFSDLKT